MIAIIITIIVLELRAPHEPSLASLKPLVPVFLSYVLSFVYIGIYWNNHHHMLHASHKFNGRILWSNLHLLFWLSLIPFTTGWMGENHFAPVPVVPAEWRKEEGEETAPGRSRSPTFLNPPDYR